MEQEILENVKLLLEPSECSDELLLFLIKDIAAAVMDRCRIDFVPGQLYGLIAQITAQLYGRVENGGVKSVAEGERRVEFEGGCGGDILESFAARLEPFVNRSARLPSEADKNEG